MTTGRPNRLVRESSPYLRQHAYNPVDWYPWGPEALARAQAEDKPILLSIGYSACHWCHVMAHESFEDPRIAARMNELYVNIKVDREERPDLDHIYQQAAQLMGRQGGWPLTAFLLPDQRPFFIGTYFPPDNRYGRPGFDVVLEQVHQVYRGKRDQVEQVAEEVLQALGQLGTAPKRRLPPAEDALIRAAANLAGSYDAKHGGFGRAPKFPHATALELLLWASRPGYAAESGGSPSPTAPAEGRALPDSGRLEAIALHSLEAMARGGIYDQIGGGFHRYAVDVAWSVPHFEKMLYDNALLPPVYLAAYRRTRRDRFARIARETLDYVLQEMTSPEGVFYATQDADSEGEEGRYYTWTPREVREVLGEEDGRLACAYWGISETGNFEGGRSVLSVAAAIPDLSARFQLPPADVEARIKAARRKLHQARAQRVPPGRDDKVLTGWNGLMLRALSMAGPILAAGRFTAAARRTADYLLEHAIHAESGLLRTGFPGGQPIPGYLEDYAFLAEGLLELYQAVQEPRYLIAAARLAREMVERFWDKDAGGFYLTPEGGERLITRPRDITDASTPSAQAAACKALIRLHGFTGEARFLDCCRQVFELYGGLLQRHPDGLASHILAWELYHQGAVELTLAPAEPDRRRVMTEWLPELLRVDRPELLLTVRPEAAAAIAEELTGGPEPPIWAGREAPNDGIAAYVCRRFTCSAPVYSLDALLEQLDAQSGRPA